MDRRTSTVYGCNPRLDWKVRFNLQTYLAWKLGVSSKDLNVCGPPCILRESLCRSLEELRNWAAGWIVINASNNPLLPINRPGARPMDLWAGRPSVPSKHALHYCQPYCTRVETGMLWNCAILYRPVHACSNINPEAHPILLILELFMIISDLPIKKKHQNVGILSKQSHFFWNLLNEFWHAKIILRC